MRSLFTPSLSALALLLTTALPVAADPVNSFFDVYFDVSDVDLPTTNQDNTHAGIELLFDPPPLGTDDLLYDSANGQEGIDGYSLLLDETFTPGGGGGGVMRFSITNGNYPGEPMFPGVGADVDSASLSVQFAAYAAPILGVSYTVDGIPGSDALPAFIWGEAPIDLELAWSNSPELAGAQSIQVDVTLGGVAVPEPTSLALVGGVITALLGLRRRLA
ncbi:MAG: PEP-CTERM sorting domain-containing protein [Deltaproteobacteria bacterium]|nr:PEP-CTERM sorting domain-containing protein [Deltaproteobacteria bacterium]NCP95308.1 PEP-CTERM sorting domain-containing protein [Deltaproteobacteria bacterium]NCS74203.1 PEP-CTERM sorting domain-containing protein [Deltaproteobacteria bacterium]OIP66664.1 MAG: hypothetical protein AUK30_02060 [Nitrospirae bacterium CG2_30_70_394]